MYAIKHIDSGRLLSYKIVRNKVHLLVCNLSPRWESKSKYIVNEVLHGRGKGSLRSPINVMSPNLLKVVEYENRY
jgi:hypothetical protein